MRQKKNRTIIAAPAIEKVDPDPFFRRIEVQSTIIRKILSEIDNTATPESQPELADNMDDLNIPEKCSDEQA